ncbi:sugar (pentulose or hexulose) kinase [Sinorhizobium fredii]
MKTVAVIDIGKTNAKVALVDLERFEEIAVRKTPNIVVEEGLYPHFDVAHLWRFLLQSLSGLHREHPVEAISVTTHGATAVLLDNAGELAMPVLDYEYTGPDALAEEYGQARPPFSETGSARLPMGLNVGAQLFWQQRMFPRHFAEVATILTYAQYWSYRLTGVAANEVTSLGCHTDLWNPKSATFSTMVEARGWTPLFAPVRKADEVIGGLLPALAEETCLPDGLPVYCGIHDSNASLLPHLLTRSAPFSVVSTGTWVVMMSVGGELVELDERRDTLINVNALGDPVPSARFMGGRAFSMLVGDNPPAASAGARSARACRRLYAAAVGAERLRPFPLGRAALDGERRQPHPCRAARRRLLPPFPDDGDLPRSDRRKRRNCRGRTVRREFRLCANAGRCDRPARARQLPQQHRNKPWCGMPRRRCRDQDRSGSRLGGCSAELCRLRTQMAALHR